MSDLDMSLDDAAAIFDLCPHGYDGMGGCPTCDAPQLNETERAIAELSQRDDLDAAAVWLDAMLENPRQQAWRDERVMMLCLGVPLDVRPPDHLGETGKRNWRRQRGESIAFALRQWDLYAGRDDFMRALRSVVLFGGWKLRGSSGGSPWAVVRRADPDYQEQLVQRRNRRIAREYFRSATAVRDATLREIRAERTAESNSPMHSKENGT